jgi:hypothetical protein
MVWASQNAAHHDARARCPHCNQPLSLVPAQPQSPAPLPHAMCLLGTHKLQGTLHAWCGVGGDGVSCKPPSPSEFWVRGPCFLEAKVGAPLDSKEAALVLDTWSQAILQVLGSSYASAGFAHHHPPSPSACATHAPNWVGHFVNGEYSISLSVSLVRTALVNSQGGFMQDGYVLMAERRRHLPRRSCRCTHPPLPPHHSSSTLGSSGHSSLD